MSRPDPVLLVELTVAVQRVLVADATARLESGRGRLAMMAGLAFVFAATWFCSTAMAAHLPRLLQESGASLAAAVAAAALVGPAQVAARVLEFWFLRRFHPIVSARVASLAHPIGAAGLMAAGSPAASGFAVLHGVAWGLRGPFMQAIRADYFGVSAIGMILGLSVMIVVLGQIAGPMLAGFLADLTGNYRSGFTVLALLAGLGSLFFLLAKKPARPAA